MKKTDKKKKGGSLGPLKLHKDIPLDNIPERTKQTYPLAMKKEAVERVQNGESAEAVARDLKISNGGVISKWVQNVAAGHALDRPRGIQPGSSKPKGVDVMAEMRSALERARRARDERLEMAAFIVESDAPVPKEAAELAKRIRGFKRVQ